jgi:RNA polymerase sigma-70 factor (ECF subfamily)
MFGSGSEREKEWAAFEAEALPLMADVFRVANYLTRDREEAEDLTQETFIQALKSFHRYTPGTNCRAWLVTILYHLNSKRKYKLGRLKLVEDVDEQIAQTVAFVPPIPENLKDEEILQALKRLPQAFRDAVVLSDVEGSCRAFASSDWNGNVSPLSRAKAAAPAVDRLCEKFRN